MWLNINFYDYEGNIALEILECRQLGDNTCQIKQIPLFAPNLALDDVVLFENENGVCYFEGLSLASGNSTVQIVELVENSLDKLYAELESKIPQLSFCFYNQRYMAVNIPREVVFDEIRSVLYEYSVLSLIDFKEACLGFI